MKTIPEIKADLINQLGATTPLRDLPESAVAYGSDLSELLKSLGEEGSARTVINNWNAWNAQLGEFLHNLA